MTNTLDKQLLLTQTELSNINKIHRLRLKIKGRTTFFHKMFERYKQLADSDYCREQLLNITSEYDSLLSRLDIYKLYDNTDESEYANVYAVVKNWPSDRKTHFEGLFPIEIENGFTPPPHLDYYFSQLAEGSKLSSFKQNEYYLYSELCRSLNEGWFTYFATLTVDPQHYDLVFCKGSPLWRNYIRSIKHKFASDHYGSVRNAKGEDYFEYFAVVEEGGTTERLHLHALFFTKAKPTFKDPNIGMPKPTYREIKEFQNYWPYGFSSVIAVRFGGYDPFALIGWRWPVDNKGKGIDPSSVGKLSAYLLKYIVKSKRVKLSGVSTSWKIRKSKNLGKRNLKKLLSLMPCNLLLIAVKSKFFPMEILVYGKPIPRSLLRKMLLKEYDNRTSLLPQNAEPKSMILTKLLKSTIRAKCDLRVPSFGDIIVESLNHAVTSNHEIMEFTQLKQWLETRTPIPSNDGKVKGVAYDVI